MGKNNPKKLRGFTLLEVLIASAIFAGVLIMTTVTVSSGGSYYSKLRVQRQVSEDTRYLSDLITRSVRDANLSFDLTNLMTTSKFDKGIAILNCDQAASTCAVIDSADNLGATANVLITGSTKSGNINYSIFYTSKAVDADGNVSFKIHYQKMTVVPTIASIILMANDPKYMISNSNNDVKIDFSGYAPDKNLPGLAKKQAYIQFKIVAQTLNYDNLDVRSRAQTEISSMITSRETD